MRKNRSVLISVYWLTDFGGLHENVLDTAIAYTKNGWICTIIAPKAKFNIKFVSLGIRLIEHDFADITDAARVALGQGGFDLVHAHPFQALVLGKSIAKACAAKLILTIHGQYADAIDESIDAVICVSSKIKNYIQSLQLLDSSRIHVIPNAIDEDVFRSYDNLTPISGNIRQTVITICSRIDPDKKVILQCAKDMIEYLNIHNINAQINIQGKNLYGEVKEFDRYISKFKAHRFIKITLQEWCNERDKLCQIYNSSDLVIGSGRAAAEALSCLRPTIAVASRGYVGLLDSTTIELAIASNFGGFFDDETMYSKERLVADFHKFRKLRARRNSSDDIKLVKERMLQHMGSSIVAERQCALVSRICN